MHQAAINTSSEDVVGPLGPHCLSSTELLHSKERGLPTQRGRKHISLLTLCDMKHPDSCTNISIGMPPSTYHAFNWETL